MGSKMSKVVLALGVGVLAVNGWAKELTSWQGAMTETSKQGAVKGEIWVEGSKLRIERTDEAGKKTITFSDGEKVYRYGSKAKFAGVMSPDRSTVSTPWDSGSAKASGEVTKGKAEKVAGQPCQVQSFQLLAGKDKDGTEKFVDVKEWVHADFGFVMKREQTMGDWSQGMEFTKFEMKKPEANRFSLGSMKVREPLPRDADASYFTGKPVENFTMKHYDNDKTLNLMEVCKGQKAVVLNFFATWCGPCKKETPDMVEVYNEYKKQGVEFISVDTGEQGDAVAKVKEFAGKYKVEWPIVMDDQDYNQQYAGNGIPTNMVLNSKGTIVAYSLGTTAATWFKEELDKLVKKSTP